MKSKFKLGDMFTKKHTRDTIPIEIYDISYSAIEPIYKLKLIRGCGEDVTLGEEALIDSKENWDKYEKDEPFIPEEHICKVGHPAPLCRECQCKYWTYEEPVKCACWLLRKATVPSRIMIPMDLAVKLYKQNILK